MASTFSFTALSTERRKHTQAHDLKGASGSAWLNRVVYLARLPQGRKASTAPQQAPVQTFEQSGPCRACSAGAAPPYCPPRERDLIS